MFGVFCFVVVFCVVCVFCFVVVCLLVLLFFFEGGSGIYESAV